MTLISRFMREYGLSEQGAKGLRKSIALSAVCNFTLMLPVFVILAAAMHIAEALDGGTPPSEMIVLYVAAAFFVVLVIFVAHWFQYGSLYISVYSESGNRMAALAERLRKLPLSFFTKRNLSDLTSMMVSDSAMLDQLFSHNIPQMYGAAVSTTVVGALMFVYDWRMALAALWVVPVTVVIIRSTRRVQDRLSQRTILAHREVSECVQQGIETVREIRSCNRAPTYMMDLEGKLAASEKAMIRSEAGVGAIVQTASVLLRFGIATTVLAGAYLTASGSLEFIEFLAYLYVAAVLYDPLALVLQNMAAVFSAKVRVSRMREISEEPVQDGADSMDPKGYDIVFDDVSFSYKDGESVLSGVSFTAKQGEVTALVGPSGSGKSTAARLAARFWDVDSGMVTLGGVDVSKIDPEVLLSNYSVVFQDVVLFKDTVMENIRLGRKEATDEEVLAAAKAAQCDSFVSRLPEGYRTMIGENGATLSGGERQRISIARALLKDAPVILLDEATASLDVENETAVQKAISELVRDKTVLIIAHRMRTVAGAERIVVLENGKVSQQGSPAELIEQGGLYRHMVELQSESSQWSIS